MRANLKRAVGPLALHETTVGITKLSSESIQVRYFLFFMIISCNVVPYTGYILLDLVTSCYIFFLALTTGDHSVPYVASQVVPSV